ncbi:MAG: hypothetical protein LUH82_03785 [Clostridiales bacterium]|nr:hypothetical protein [Clostridiales bacterium]
MSKVKERFIAFGNWVKDKKVSLTAAAAAGLGSASVAFPALAEDSDYVTGINTLWSSITSELNVSSIVSIIGICIGACLVAVLFWFGIRYVVRKISAAVKKGKFSA